MHPIQLRVAGANVSSQYIVGKREDNIEVLVRVSVMQVMVPGKKLVRWPLAKEALFGLVHLKVYLVPNEMMQADNNHKDDRTVQREYCNNGYDRHRL